MQPKPIYSNSFSKFLSESDSRICTILHRLDLKDRPSSIVTTKDINYITNRKDGMISYLPSNRPHLLTEDLKWSRKGRVEGRAASVIRKLFNHKFVQRCLKDADFEAFANLYKANFQSMGLRFELKNNSDIGEVYDWEREGDDGTLNNSCMRGEGNLMAIYEENNVQILALFNEHDELCGRALVWNDVVLDDDKSNKVTFMDRVYTSQDFMYELFADYAASNKWHYKRDYKSGGGKDALINPDGNIVFHKMTVYLDTDHGEYPYIDTFCYGGDGWLSNDKSDSCYIYQNTGGDRDETNRQWDELNQESIADDDARFIDHGRYSGHYIHFENAVCVDGDYWWEDDEDIVSIDGQWYTKDDDDIVEIDGDWYRTDNDEVYYCECDDEYHLSDDIVFTDDGCCILKSNAVEVGGRIYHKDNVNKLV